jgi:hypothetical protein
MDPVSAAACCERRGHRWPRLSLDVGVGHGQGGGVQPVHSASKGISNPPPKPVKRVKIGKSLT